MELDARAIEGLSPEQLETVLRLIEEIERREKGNVIKFLYPPQDIHLTPGEFPATHKLFEGAETIYSLANYPKHKEFWDKGAEYAQRMLRAGNRVGKTVAGACEVAWHTTGLYPDWWQGKRFTTCNDWWVCGVSQETVIEILQPLFLGPVGQFGTGLIPIDHIDFSTLKDARKEKTGVGTMRIKHVNGTYSTISFKSYEQGRDKFQGTAKSILLDEEPPQDIYAECLMRTATGGNILMMTFTPLSGVSDLINSWFPAGDVTATGDVGNGRWVTGVGMDDVLHLDQKKIEDILSSYPPFQRTARRLGHPTLEEGAIYPVEETTFIVEPFEIPKHWRKAYGLDVGRNTAAIWLAHDVESDTYYTYSEFFMAEGLPSTHAQAVMARGKWMTGAIDTSARGRSATDGDNLYSMYTQLGLNITNAEKAVEAGLYRVLELLSQGRLKVFSTCQHLIKEIRGYRRDKNGKVVKSNDHALDAWRYALMTPGIFQTEAEAVARIEAQTGRVFDMADIYGGHKDAWML